MYSENPQAPDLKLGVNLLRNDQRPYRLPSLDCDTHAWLKDGSVIELVLLDVSSFSVESWEFPIRFGKYFGNRVMLNPMYDQFNINPKFLFDAEKKQWVLMNAGYVCFMENEIEHKTNHKLYGQKEA